MTCQKITASGFLFDNLVARGELIGVAVLVLIGLALIVLGSHKQVPQRVSAARA